MEHMSSVEGGISSHVSCAKGTYCEMETMSPSKGTYNMYPQTQVNKHFRHKIHKYLYDYYILLLQVQNYYWEEGLQAESN